MEKIDVKVKIVPISELLADPRNARVHDDENIAAIRDSLVSFGQQKPIVVERGGRVIAGNGTLVAAQQLGWTKIAISQSSLTDMVADAYGLVDNRSAELASWREDALSATLKQLDDAKFDLGLLHFDKDELDRLLNKLPPPDKGPNLGGLSKCFLLPPFTVLDARQGYWQERKRIWLSLGIKSEVGRGAGAAKEQTASQDKLTALRKPKTGRDAQLLIGGKKVNADGMAATISHAGVLHKGESGLEWGEQYEGGDCWGGTGTSIFDPVLCELAYTWFSAKGGAVLDPFAGGSVRGIVAAKLGRSYTGIDLRPEQVEANWAQAAAILPPKAGVEWIAGDSLKVLDKLRDEGFDLLMSCPPYADLEVYSDDPADLSNMPYDQFMDTYSDIIIKAVAKLKPNRFIFWVVGDIREPKGGGYYRGFVPDTIKAFEAVDARLYNEAVLVTSVGTLPLRVPRIFAASRKMGKTHQNVLVFCKGDPVKAAKACGDVEVWQPSEDELAEAQAVIDSGA